MKRHIPRLCPAHSARTRSENFWLDGEPLPVAITSKSSCCFTALASFIYFDIKINNKLNKGLLLSSFILSLISLFS